MGVLELLSVALVGIAVIGGFSLIAMTLYLGRRHVQKVDRAVLGYELPTDIVSLALRVPNYAGGFAWRFSARRTKLAGKIEHFDRKFQRPFIITFWLMIISGCAMILGVVIDKLFLVGS